jgi:hypothetical protein
MYAPGSQRAWVCPRFKDERIFGLMQQMLANAVWQKFQSTPELSVNLNSEGSETSGTY